MRPTVQSRDASVPYERRGGDSQIVSVQRHAYNAALISSHEIGRNGASSRTALCVGTYVRNARRACAQEWAAQNSGPHITPLMLRTP